MIKKFLLTLVTCFSLINLTMANEVDKKLPKPSEKTLTEKVTTLLNRPFDPGGNLEDYITLIMEAEILDIQPKITGFCASACTLKLAITKCVEPNTLFMFHKPYLMNLKGDKEDAPPLSFMMMLAMYKPQLAHFLYTKLHKLSDEVYITGTQIQNFGYTLCND